MIWMSILLAALIQVESSGGKYLVGRDGKSWGQLQITDICREDVNRISGRKYTREDCFDLDKSLEMFFFYINHYATAERLGHEPTAEDVARIWNGGPNGWKKAATLKYWKKVEKAMKELAQ